MLDKTRSQLMIIDVQQRLLPVMAHADEVPRYCAILLQAAQELKIPAIITEQYPKGLGPTVMALSGASKSTPILEKLSFSCNRDEIISQHLENQRREGRDQVVIGGIESHVCVMQTALDLIDAGYEVFIVADAISSRAASSRKLAIARMRQAGATIMNTEMAVFEWLERAGTAEFKALSALIK